VLEKLSEAGASDGLGVGVGDGVGVGVGVGVGDGVGVCVGVGDGVGVCVGVGDGVGEDVGVDDGVGVVVGDIDGPGDGVAVWTGVALDEDVGDTLGDGLGEAEGELASDTVSAIVVFVFVLVSVMEHAIGTFPVITNVVPGEPEIESDPFEQVVVATAGPSAAGILSVSDLPTRRSSEFAPLIAIGDAVIASVAMGAIGPVEPPPPHPATTVDTENAIEAASLRRNTIPDNGCMNFLASRANICGAR
jgi:hypothetical protein